MEGLGVVGILLLHLLAIAGVLVSGQGFNSSGQENPTSGGLNLTIISPLQHDNFTFVNTSGNNITSTNKETPPNNTTTNNITLSNTTSAPPSDVNTTLSDVTTDYDNVTVNVTFCRPGYGYPEFCPRPSDPVTFTKCCRYYMEPRCCEERARKVCASRNRGMDYVSAFDIDPEPDMVAIFCPQPDQSDDYTSCGYTKEDMICFNRVTAVILVWVTAVIIFFVFPLAFGVFTCYEMRKERKRDQELLASGITSRIEVEVVKGKVIRREESIGGGKLLAKRKQNSVSIEENEKEPKGGRVSGGRVRMKSDDVEKNDTFPKGEERSTRYMEDSETQQDGKANHNNIKQRKKNTTKGKSADIEDTKESDASKSEKKKSKSKHIGDVQRKKERAGGNSSGVYQRKNGAANDSEDIEILRSSQASISDNGIAKGSTC